MVYPITKLAVFPLFRLFLKEVRGIENIPKEGTFVLAANHESYLDPFLLHSIFMPYIDKKLHFLAMKGRGFKWFGDYISREWAGVVPLDEGKKKAFKALLNFLKKNEPVALFPGGRRELETSSELPKGKTGAVRLALLAGVPVIPVGLVGTAAIAPGQKIVPRLKRAKMRIGKPITYGSYSSKKITKRILRKLTNSLMAQIAKLCNKKYLNNTNKDVKNID